MAKDCPTGDVRLHSIIELVLVGGWPATRHRSAEEGILVSREYINSVLSEDIYKTDNVKRDRHKVELLLRSLARNESTTATNRGLRNDIKEKDFDDINVDTIVDYLDWFAVFI